MHNLFFSVSCRQNKFKFSVSFNFVQTIMSYYAVAKGRNPGIYRTWDECKSQVNKFSGPIYKKFGSKSEAEDFIKQHAGASTYLPKFSSQSKFNSLPTQETYALGKKLQIKPSTSSLKRLMSSSSSNESDQESENTNRKRMKNDKTNKTTKNKDGFFIDENGFTEVYTDGACASNGRGNAKAGIGVWFSDNNELNVSQPVVGRATNNMAEIQAVTIAARQAQKAGIKKLKISTDSKFLISCITEWMPKWKRCKWQTASGKPVINKTELIEMEKALAPLQISWNHVRGHVGIHGNEMADKLAREGSERYRQK